VAGSPRIRPNGDLEVTDDLVIPASDLRVRASTPGGPGGQHANRTESRVTVSFNVAHSEHLNEPTRAILLDALGPSISSSSSASRSQLQNKVRAATRLAQRIADALEVAPPRKSTRPTRGAVERRISDKRHRSRTKSERRRRDDD
jgi:ribosome-associated protein